MNSAGEEDPLSIEVTAVESDRSVDIHRSRGCQEAGDVLVTSSFSSPLTSKTSGGVGERDPNNYKRETRGGTLAHVMNSSLDPSEPDLVHGGIEDEPRPWVLPLHPPPPSPPPPPPPPLQNHRHHHQQQHQQQQHPIIPASLTSPSPTATTNNNMDVAFLPSAGTTTTTTTTAATTITPPHPSSYKSNSERNRDGELNTGKGDDPCRQVDNTDTDDVYLGRGAPHNEMTSLGDSGPREDRGRNSRSSASNSSRSRSNSPSSSEANAPAKSDWRFVNGSAALSSANPRDVSDSRNDAAGENRSRRDGGDVGTGRRGDTREDLVPLLAGSSANNTNVVVRDNVSDESGISPTNHHLHLDHQQDNHNNNNNRRHHHHHQQQHHPGGRDPERKTGRRRKAERQKLQQLPLPPPPPPPPLPPPPPPPPGLSVEEEVPSSVFSDDRHLPSLIPWSSDSQPLLQASSNGESASNTADSAGDRMGLPSRHGKNDEMKDGSAELVGYNRGVNAGKSYDLNGLKHHSPSDNKVEDGGAGPLAPAAKGGPLEGPKGPSPDNKEVLEDVTSVDKEEDEDEGGPCGWGWLQVGFCQRFRDPRWFLLVLTMCGACQGMAVNGFVNTVISTIERRFEISSTESGLIASCYDIMFVLLVIPISYFGGMGWKPRYLGIGMFVMGLGSYVFALPHFLSDEYRVENAAETVCGLSLNTSGGLSCESNGEPGVSNYKYFFFLGQLLHGAGATALYTLGVTYMDENVAPRASSFYNGIFYTGAIVGPAVGYILGSVFLGIYTDVGVDPKSLGLQTTNPRWVGAWWLGFLITGTFAILLSLPMLAFPAALPGSRQFAAQRGQEVHAQSQADQTGRSRGVKDILLSIRLLLTNIPFMLINVAAAADAILVAGYSTFLPKFIEYQFGLSSGKAALYMGLVTVPCGGGATFLGGFLVRFFNLKVRGILLLCTVASAFVTLVGLILVMQCETAPFAGVTLDYGKTSAGNTTYTVSKNLDNHCNAGCNCAEQDYFPMCGRDDVMYFSPCYAGCRNVTVDGSTKRYSDCSCVSYNVTADDVASGREYEGEFGKCERSCKWLAMFMVMLCVLMILIFVTSMPSLTATLRCVPDHQRSFGLGIQWIVARCLGSIPGPILFGKMFDLACLVWQQRCDGDGSCFIYDNRDMSINIMVVSIVFAVLAALAFFLANFFYKVKPADEMLEMDTPSRESSQVTIVPDTSVASTPVT